MSFNAVFDPGLSTWWQFLIISGIITVIVYVIFYKFSILLLSEALHPKVAKKIGTMAAFLVMGLAIIINLAIHLVKHIGQSAEFLFSYLFPLILSLAFIIAFFFTRAQLETGEKQGHKP